MSKVEEPGRSFNLLNNHERASSKNKHKIVKKRINLNFSKMSNLRIIQKPLVYVIGLSASLALKDVL